MKTILLLSLFSFTLLFPQGKPDKVISIEELNQKKNRKNKEIKERLETLKELVNKKDKDAIRELANNYYFGILTKRDYRKAFVLYLKGSILKEPICIYNLAQCYYYGQGTKKNEEKALAYFKEAAKLGVHEAIINAANILDKKKNFIKARQLFEKAFYQKKSIFSYKLIDYYLDGIGGPKNYEKAILVAEKLAQSGDQKTQYKLAQLYKTDKYIPADDYLYITWLSIAANNGYLAAQYELAKYFLNRKNPDVRLAYHWGKNAADKNYAPAVSFLGDCYFLGINVAQNETNAFEYYKRAYRIDPQYDENTLKLAEAYLIGIGYVQNHKKAKSLFNKLIERNDPQTLIIVSNYYLHGKLGFEKNPKKAFQIISKTVNKPTPNSLLSLAQYYFYGHGTKKNLMKAKLFLNLAIEKGSIEALDFLLDNQL